MQYACRSLWGQEDAQVIVLACMVATHEAVLPKGLQGMLGLSEGQGLYPGSSRSTGALAHPHSQVWFLLYGLDHWLPPLWSHGV